MACPDRDPDPYGELDANRPSGIYWRAYRWQGHGAPVQVSIAELDAEPEPGDCAMRELPAAAGRPIEPAAQGSTAERMTALASRFPSLQRAPGVRPFDPERLDAWAAGPAPSSGAVHAARFVLSVFNARAEWSCGPFSCALAHGTWDREHREAFAAWVDEGGWLA